MSNADRRTVQLRQEHEGKNFRYLWAYVDENGDLHIDGQDLGPATSLVSADGEYEWFQTISAQHVPAVIAVLGGQPGDDVLDVLEDGYSGLQSYDLEALLRESDIPINRFVY